MWVLRAHLAMSASTLGWSSGKKNAAGSAGPFSFRAATIAVNNVPRKKEIISMLVDRFFNITCYLKALV